MQNKAYVLSISQNAREEYLFLKQTELFICEDLFEFLIPIICCIWANAA